ncbi:hypothetical protein PG994_006765 [Apiospora phragmitis]|uniref:Uncharacterized protein n=1 Tax=Apiospora phragmitis TaxID=2905665 RepID=A0ABR1VG00_9PEZI
MAALAGTDLVNVVNVWGRWRWRYDEIPIHALGVQHLRFAYYSSRGSELLFACTHGPGHALLFAR